MASNLKVATATANAQANALVGAYTNGALLRIYDGTQPASPETAITSQNLLATVTFPSPAFGSASNGTLTANSISSVSASQSGTASWFRLLKSDGVTPILDGSIGTSGSDLNLGSLALTAGGQIQITGFTYTIPNV